MIVGTIILLSVGILLSIFGILIAKKEKIELFHDYHYKNVKEEDKSAFCKVSGSGIFSIGIGIIICALLFLFTESPLCFISLGIGFIVGLPMLIYGANKYNSNK